MCLSLPPHGCLFVEWLPQAQAARQVSSCQHLPTFISTFTYPALSAHSRVHLFINVFRPTQQASQIHFSCWSRLISPNTIHTFVCPFNFPHVPPVHCLSTPFSCVSCSFNQTPLSHANCPSNFPHLSLVSVSFSLSTPFSCVSMFPSL